MKKLIFLLGILTLISSCKEDPKPYSEPNQTTSTTSTSCIPDMDKYGGYSDIIYHTFQYPPSETEDNRKYLASQNIVPLGDRFNYNAYMDWRYKDPSGCGVMHYFISAVVEGFHGEGIMEVSDIHETSVNQLTIDFIYKSKDEYLKKLNILYQKYPVAYHVHVVDGPYSVASEIRNDYINLAIQNQ